MHGRNLRIFYGKNIEPYNNITYNMKSLPLQTPFDK
jgi:hypothetical protein